MGQIASPLASLDMDEDRFRAYLQHRVAALGANELGVAWTMPDGWTTTQLVGDKVRRGGGEERG